MFSVYVKFVKQKEKNCKEINNQQQLSEETLYICIEPDVAATKSDQQI